jgi:hypothetical protein
MRKKKLEADINYDFSVIGMITPMKEYKLAWYINKVLHIQLIKENDIELDFLKSSNILISNYFHETEHSYFRLLKNKSINDSDEKPAYILPELMKFDYLILTQGYEAAITLQEMKKALNQIPKVQYVQVFQIEDLKSKENLIF